VAAPLLVISTLVTAPRIAHATDTPVFRIFLRDGTTLTSYGEYARVNGRIVFSVPLGPLEGQPHLQLVTLDASQVDWPRTDRYRDAVRGAQYAATRGESDFTLMTGEVAQVLNDIALTPDPHRRLTLAEEARRRLNDWPATHYGYRAGEVREIAGLLDEAVSDFRAAAGEQAFDLNLVATVEAPPGEQLLPAPTPSEIIAQALSIGEVSDVPAERVALLRSTLAYIDTARGVPETSRAAARDFARRRLEGELGADRSYAALDRDVTRLADARAARGDVRGMERLIASVDRRDAALGRRRPDQVRAIIARLRDRLDGARRLRLARDRWRLRSAAYRSYTRLVREPLADLDAIRASLEDIRRLAGPDIAQLTRIGELSDKAARSLHTIVPPSELARTHGLLQSACAMSGNAARIRLEAVGTGDVSTAWKASAAATGALMLLGRARDDMAEYLSPPRLR
jgi:hypothetical protein